MPSCIYCFNVVEMAANLYSELREEARDHARLRNAYFEQVCFESHFLAIFICYCFLSLSHSFVNFI